MEAEREVKDFWAGERGEHIGGGFGGGGGYRVGKDLPGGGGWRVLRRKWRCE